MVSTRLTVRVKVGPSYKYGGEPPCRVNIQHAEYIVCIKGGVQAVDHYQPLIIAVMMQADKPTWTLSDSRTGCDGIGLREMHPSFVACNAGLRFLAQEKLVQVFCNPAREPRDFCQGEVRVVR